MKNAGIYKDGETPKQTSDRLSEFDLKEREKTIWEFKKNWHTPDLN